MATLTGQNIANTYKQLLQVGSDNAGLTTSVQTIQDGSGTNSALQLSQSAVNINGTFQLNGTTLTATASALNAVPDITAYTGFIAVSGTNINGRTLVAGTGVSITNADGTEGNPNIFLNTTGVTSGTYGPATNFEVNAVGQVVSAGAATSVSVSAVTANTFTGGTFEGTTGNFSSNVSVGGNLTITGAFSPAVVSTSAVNATTGTFSSTVSAGFFYGDGSNLINVPSAEGGTVKRIEAGQGIRITVDGAVSASIPVSGTVAVSANQNFGTVSVSTAIAVTGSAKFGIVSATNVDTDELLIAGVSAANVTEVAVVSALTQVNLDSITSINAIIGDGGNYATSAELAAVSAALATSIGNSNTNITANANAITSINTVVANVSALTSVNAAAITSINTVVAGVSALTSVNAAAITSINAVIEGNVSADSGTFNTLTVITSASVGGTFNVGGNVGIGTSSPNANYAQTIVGNLAIGSGSAAALGGENFIVTDGTTTGKITLGGGPTVQFGSKSNHPVTFFVANAEKVRIDSSGNVGIGTTSPSTKLDITGSGAYSNRIIHIAGDINPTGYDSGTSGARIGFTYGATPVEVAGIRSGVTNGGAGSETAQLVFSTANSGTLSEKMRITSSGNVGIGSVNGLDKLHVYEEVNSAVATQLLLQNQGGGNHAAGIAFQVTSSAEAALTVYAPKAAIIQERTTAYGRGPIKFMQDNAADANPFGAGDEVMRIESSGNVGIGTSSPDFLLDVAGRIGILEGTNGIAFHDGAGSVSAGVRADSGDNLVFATGSSDTERMRIDSGGNVAVGRTSSVGGAKVTVETGASTPAVLGYGDRTWLNAYDPNSGGTPVDLRLWAYGNSNATNDAYVGTWSAHPLKFATGGSIRATIDTSGNVGIGTTSPAKQFEITKASRALIGTLTDGATITPDFDANQNFTVTLGGNRTLANPTNVDAGQTGSIFVVQDATGGRTLSFGSYWKFAGGTAPTLSTGTNAVDRIDYIVKSATEIHAVASLNLS